MGNTHWNKLCEGTTLKLKVLRDIVGQIFLDCMQLGYMMNFVMMNSISCFIFGLRYLVVCNFLPTATRPKLKPGGSVPRLSEFLNEVVWISICIVDGWSHSEECSIELGQGLQFHSPVALQPTATLHG